MCQHVQWKEVFINECDILFFIYKGILGKVICIEEEDMFCNHEEADTRMFHAIISLPPDVNVVVRTNNTAICIIGLGCLSVLRDSYHIWLEVGVWGRNTFRYIYELGTSLGEDLCNAMPFYRALTGCDYTVEKEKLILLYYWKSIV